MTLPSLCRAAGLKKSQLAETMFLFLRIVSSKNELFLSQNLIPQQALSFS